MAEVITRALAAATDLADGTTLADQIDVRSAGTGPWHEGEPMHPLAADRAAPGRVPRPPPCRPPDRLRRAGPHRSLVALDRRHQQTLRSLGADPGRLALLRSFDPAAGAAADVPDPYYGDDAVFDDCRDMIARRLQRPRRLPGVALGHLLGRLGLSPTPRMPTDPASALPARTRQAREFAGQEPSGRGSPAESVP